MSKLRKKCILNLNKEWGISMGITEFLDCNLKKLSFHKQMAK